MEIHSVQDYITLLEKLKELYTYDEPIAGSPTFGTQIHTPEFIYRGHGRKSYKLLPGILRTKNLSEGTQIAEYAQENGYYLKGTGTSWSLLTEGASYLGVEGREISLSKKTVQTALQQGQPIICSVGPGDFTTEGHFIVLTGMKYGKIKVNDPNCIRRSCLWDYEVLEPQIKNLWAYCR